MELRDVLVELRKLNDLTQSDVAHVLDVTIQAYNRYELGQRKITLQVLDRLAAFYEIPIQTFFVWNVTNRDNPKTLSLSILASLFDLLQYQKKTLDKRLDELENTSGKISDRELLIIDDLEKKRYIAHRRLKVIEAELSRRV